MEGEIRDGDGVNAIEGIGKDEGIAVVIFVGIGISASW